MKWLWYVGPLVVALIYLLVAFWPTRRERWRKAELLRWVEDFLGPLPPTEGKPAKRRGKRDTDKADGPAEPGGPRLLGRLPGAFERLLQTVGLGTTVGNVVLVPKLAYLTVRGADRITGSDHQTVVTRLAKTAPQMVVRPLPMVEGRRAENRGVEFGKDPEFMEHFVVEGEEQKAIVKWLRPAMREALVEFPDVWVRTQGKMMAVTLYGEANAQRIDELVSTADAVFAERGAGGAPSLFGDEDHVKGPSREEARDEAPPAELATLSTRLKAVGLDVLLYALALAAILGVFGLRAQGLEGLSLHQLLSVGSADPLDGPWQGGWTTRGFGALFAAEAFLIGLFILQTYLAARRGQTIGMRLFGARVVRLNDERVTFYRGVLFRTWLIALIPLAVAALLTRPFDIRAFITNVAQPRIALIALGAIVVDTVLMFIGANRRCLHDYTAGTKVVSVPGGLARLIRR